MASRDGRVAVVLLNLGGPDRPEAVRPFLINLFSDPAILRVPFFVRWFLARWIARSRFRPAAENYAMLGGRSPILNLTRAQAVALEDELADVKFRCFMAMRYWEPLSDAAAVAVHAWGAKEVVLLPLYPQFSTTTTASSLTAWREAAAQVGLAAKTHVVCCYPTEPGFIAAVTGLARTAYEQARQTLPPGVPVRVLFSAHGLPESIVRSGDPYQWQVDQTVAAIVAAWGDPGLDWVTCYQSRATPQKWIDPSTNAEIERAAHDKVAVVVVPVAFVSEHTETLVELDIEYRALADRLGVPGYFRVSTPRVNASFIKGLATLVRQAYADDAGVRGQEGYRLCPAGNAGCPCRRTKAA